MKCPLCEEGTLVSVDGCLGISGYERFVCDNCNAKIDIEHPDIQ